VRIALIMENSQASKNALVYETLKKVCDRHGFELDNYGMTGAEDKNLTYVQEGLLASILLNSGAADFVVTGCGTGEGAMLALNSFPGVFCGHVQDSTDAYLFSQINAGNAIALPFAKGFGWGSEITLEAIFERLFQEDFGGGYPKERREPEQANKKILDSVKTVTCRPLTEILSSLDRDFVLQTIDRSTFRELFFKHCQDDGIRTTIEEILSTK
jgi:ribose 5-phosphate isomerase RpiB